MRARTKVRFRNPTNLALAESGVEEITAITTGNRTYHFRKPMHVEVSREPGVVNLTAAEFELLVYGETYDKAMHALATSFHLFLKLFAEAPDDDLHHTGRALKKRMLKAVSEIEVDYD